MLSLFAIAILLVKRSSCVMSESVPRVSVVIPTKNAGPLFEYTLRAIDAQRFAGSVEIVVIDSGSRDGTVARSKAYGARVIRVAPSQFGHGRTRNEAISQCHGQYVVLIVQDAVPADALWLSSLVQVLDEHPRAAGAYSRHLPKEGAGFIAQRVAAYWHRQQRGRVVQRIDDPTAFDALPIEEKQKRCTFNNVSSIIRRSVWEQIPFRDVSFGEDLAWGYDVLRAGHSIVYEPDSLVRHSHERSIWYEFRRAYLDAKTVGELSREQAHPLSVWQVARLCGLWRWVCTFANTFRHQESINRALFLQKETRDERVLYREPFSSKTLVRIFGGMSPYGEEERRDLLWALARDYDDRGGQRRAACAAELQTQAPSTGSGRERLDKRINEAVWDNDDTALTKQDIDFIYERFWDEIGRDYVRRAVEEQASFGPDQGFLALKMRIRKFANEFIEAALQEGVLTSQLNHDICLYAAATLIGRRLGFANHNGTGGRWGRALDVWLPRGI
jgi:rhamnosyltransferase